MTTGRINQITILDQSGQPESVPPDW